MDSFLERFQGEGSLDSRGVFTINVEKAQVKLSSFQLASYSQFPTFLLGAGKAAGATGLSISFSGRDLLGKTQRTRIEFSGWSISPHELQSLGMETLKKETPRALRYLGTVLSTIGHRHDFSLSSQDFKMVSTRGIIQPLETSPANSPKNSVVVEIEAGLRSDLEHGFAGQEKFSSMVVRLGPREFPSDYNLVSETLSGFGFLVKQSAALPPVSVANCPSGSLLELPHRESYPPMALGFSRPLEAEEAGLWLQVEDLTYRAPSDFCPAGIFGLVVADELRRDLSFKLIQDAEYSRLRDQVHKAVRLLCGQLKKRKARLNDSRSDSLRKICLALGVEWSTSNILSQVTHQSVSLEPTKDSSKLGAFLARLDNIAPIRVEVLIEGYHRLVSISLREGKPDEALEWRRAQIAVMHRVGQETPVERFSYQLLQLLNDTGPSQPGPIPDLPNEIAGQAHYVRALCRWWAGKQPSAADLSNFKIHCSWLYPLGLAPDCTHGWVRVASLLAAAQAEAALELVRSDSSLGYTGNEAQWLEYFWAWHRGRFSWSESIKLRVQLSFATIGSQMIDLSTFTFASLQDRLLYKEFGGSLFWALFLELKSRATPQDMRDFWVKLIARVLLDNCLKDPTASLLSRPMTPHQQ